MKIVSLFLWLSVLSGSYLFRLQSDGEGQKRMHQKIFVDKTHHTHTYDEVTDWKKSWSKVDGQNHTHRCFSYAIFDVNSYNIVAVVYYVRRCPYRKATSTLT